MEIKMVCSICGMKNEKYNRVVIDSDTNCTILIKRDSETEEAFTNRYCNMVDSGRYVNATAILIECSSCKIVRDREVEEELEYWNERLGNSW
jgi:hypothetical protein